MLTAAQFDDFFPPLPSAKPVRPGHFSAFVPTNPSFLRGYSDHPIAFYKAAFPSSNQPEAPAPASLEDRTSSNETNGNQDSSDGTNGTRDYKFQDHVQDNAWVPVHTRNVDYSDITFGILIVWTNLFFRAEILFVDNICNGIRET